MLAAVLNERKLATRHVLAAAFDVSLGTLNNALADALPVIREAGITTATARFSTTEQLLATIAAARQDRLSGTDTPTR